MPASTDASRFGFIVLAAAVLLSALSLKPADTLPVQIPDGAFWRMVADFSEGAGSFRFQYIYSWQQLAVTARLRPFAVNQIPLGPKASMAFTFR